MATAIQRRRGNTAQHASFTGLAGEITIDTDKNTVVVHDGTTAGGHALAKASEVQALGGADITAVVAGDGLTGGATSGNATINVVGGDGITVSADSVAVNATYVKGLFSATDAGGDGSFSYSNGVFTYTGPSASDVRAHFSAGTGITITSGAIAVDSTIATKDYANTAASAAVAAVIDAAPATLDTLNELAAALGDDANFSTTITNSISSKLATADFNSTANTWIGTQSTTALAEGTNLYFTAARARGNISVTDNGGDGSLSYDNSTGVISYTGPSASDVRAHFSAGTGVSYDNTTGVISIGQAVSTGSNVTFDTVSADVIGNLTGTVTGNVTGTVTGTVSSIANHSTTNLAEGANLYFTTARVRGNISVTDNGGDGSLSYDTANGVISYTGPSATEVRAHFTGGNGLTLTDGTFAVGAGTGITVNADDVAVNATYVKGLFSATDSGGDGSFSYSDGVFTYVGPSQAEANARIDARISVTDAGGDGSLTYSSGVFTYTGPSQAEANTRIDARLSGTNGVNYNGGVISLESSTAGDGLTFSAGVLNVGAGDGITVAANTVALASTAAGGGLTYTSGVLAVGAGNYITIATDSIAVDATTTATASKVAARDASGDIYANIFQGTATSARYADLAERYEADAILEPGTVVCFGGTKEITACDHENDHAVAGVVSTDPAYMMNSAAGNNDTHPYIALTGRVPVKVVGPVAKGDLLVASGVKGHAMANNNAKAGTIIGKAIGSSDSGEGVVEALINLM